VNVYRRSLPLFTFGLFIFVALVNVTSASAQVSEKDSLSLSVTLSDPYNADVQVRLGVKVGKPFQITLENGDVKTTISGTIRDQHDNEYPVTITVREWVSATNNNMETAELHLKLDRPSGYGLILSIGYLRTVTLSRKTSPQ